MKIWKFTLWSLCAATAVPVACDPSDDPSDEAQPYLYARYESTTIPAAIPGEGGVYDLNFVIESATRSRSAGMPFDPFSYRLVVGDAAGDAVTVDRPATEIEVAIPANRSKEERDVVVEMASGSGADAGTWTKIVEARQTALLKDYELTEYESTTLPAQVPYNGGDYELVFRSKIETRAAEPEFVPWQYRLTVGGEPGEPVLVAESTERIAVHVDPNYTQTVRSVIVEMAEAGDAPVWTKLVEAEQESAFMEVAGICWAKGNVTLRDGRFALADRMSETGLFFRHGSRYGVRSDEASYGGTAYTPDPVQIAAFAIPQHEGDDPCRMIADELRTPTYIELYYLWYEEDYENLHMLDGISGMGYTGSSYFLPLGGYFSVPSSSVMGRSANGAFWGQGANYAGDGVIYTISSEYSIVDYDLVGENMAMLRCVKNRRQPRYVSHTPVETPADNGIHTLTVVTDPGEYDFYEVALEADDGTYTQTGASDNKSEVAIHVPKNESKEARTWRLFVDRIYTGVEFVQPGVKNYAFYVSHTPASAGYEAFTLSVTCDSDKDSFPVTIKGSDGLELNAAGSMTNPTVDFSVPANEGTTARTLAIWVDGTDTKRSVTQGFNQAAARFSVIWSEGALTVRDGAYAFAAPDERGMYFKYRSRYGYALADPIGSSSKYSGTVYGPEAMQMAYADIPCEEVDPCSLVAPAGTWRMPKAAEMEELVAGGSKEFVSGKYRVCSDGEQDVCLVASGQSTAGTSLTMATSIFAWVDEESQTKPGQYRYLMWSGTSASGKGSVSAGGAKPTVSMMVRCVRAK